MNKITPHMLRDLNATLPEGTECYLCSAIRRALTKYRKGHEPEVLLDKERAVPILAQRLGRGLKRFLREDMQAEISAEPDSEAISLTITPQIFSLFK
jgi:hypothetical protein